MTNFCAQLRLQHFDFPPASPGIPKTCGDNLATSATVQSKPTTKRAHPRGTVYPARGPPDR
eukprot:5443395-Pyramimonas_sp.AAC.1